MLRKEKWKAAANPTIWFGIQWMNAKQVFQRATAIVLLPPNRRAKCCTQFIRWQLNNFQPDC